jgi:hypothetical protein
MSTSDIDDPTAASVVAAFLENLVGDAVLHDASVRSSPPTSAPSIHTVRKSRLMQLVAAAVGSPQTEFREPVSALECASSGISSSLSAASAEPRHMPSPAPQSTPHLPVTPTTTLSGLAAPPPSTTDADSTSYRTVPAAAPSLALVATPVPIRGRQRKAPVLLDHTGHSIKPLRPSREIKAVFDVDSAMNSPALAAACALADIAPIRRGDELIVIEPELDPEGTSLPAPAFHHKNDAVARMFLVNQ